MLVHTKLFLHVALICIITSVVAVTKSTNPNTCSFDNEFLSYDSIKPIHYNLKFIAKPPYKIIEGITSIIIDVQCTTKIITLHADRLQIKNTTELRTLQSNSQEDVYTVQMQTYNEEGQNHILMLQFDRDISPGLFNLTIKYTVTLTKDISLLNYPLQRNDDTIRWLLITLFKPNTARKMYPCWDELLLKTTFNISISHPVEYMALSNMLEREREYEEGGRVWTHFDESPNMSVSDVTFVILERNNIERTDNIYNTLSVLHKKQLKRQLRFMEYIIEKAMLYMTWYTGTKRITPKTEYIVLPDLSEPLIRSKGLSIYREEDVIYNQSTDFPGRKYDIALLVTHEIARQWFRDIINLFSWSELWLNEAITLFFSYFITDKILTSSLDTMNLYVVQYLQPNLRDDYVFHRNGITNFTTDEIDANLFTPLKYSKGCALMRMIQLSYSEEFQKNIYEQFDKYNSSVSASFWSFNVTEFSREMKQEYNIINVVNAWLKNKYYPVVKVSRDYNNGAVTIEQYSVQEEKIAEEKIEEDKTEEEKIAEENTARKERANKKITEEKEAEENKEEEKNNYNRIPWTIPITIATRSNPDFSNVQPQYWLKSEKLNLTTIDRNDWIIVNLQQVGPYRVNYDVRNWEKIARILNYEDFQQIHVINRAQLIDDSYYFMIKHQLHTETFLNIIRYLKRETNYIAWYPMMNIFSYISNYFDYTESMNIKPMMLDILSSLLRKLGYEKRPEDNDMINTLRLLAIKWACKLGHTECRKKATDMLYEHLQSPETTTIKPWLKDWVFCMGIMNANMSIWQMMMDRYSVTGNNMLLKYLGCSDDNRIILYYLQWVELKMSLMKKTSQHEWHDTIYRNIMQKHANKDAVLDGILQNLKNNINKNIGVLPLYDVIINVNSEKKLNKIKTAVNETLELDKETTNTIEYLMAIRLNQIKKIQNTFDRF